MKKVIQYTKNNWIYIYCVVMLFVFLSYIYLELLKYGEANKLTDGEMISAADVVALQQRMNWASGVEGIFTILFVIGLVFCIYNKSIKPFIIINLILFILIILTAFIFYLFTPSPLGNMVQPLFVPIFISAVVILCTAVIKAKKHFKSRKYNLR